MTGRERVAKSLKFAVPDRVPRDLWLLPIVRVRRREELESLLRAFPLDIASPPYKRGLSARQKRSFALPWGYGGTFTEKGKDYIDEWGCIRRVGEDGVSGEVKEPILDDLSTTNHLSPPWDYLESTDLTGVNAHCARSESFMLSDLCARPFERMQFLRGTENLLLDLGYAPKEIFILRDMIHEYNLKRLSMWLSTDVDGILLMDDWGSERNLLISPSTWRSFLKPLYREYCDLIHKNGKYVFFHSDGYIEKIFDDLIELGIEAINSQLFCMDIERIGRQYRGKITFWGEIDRRLLFRGDKEEIRKAVSRVRRALDDAKGGVIAQCEWGKSTPKVSIETVFEAWATPPQQIA
ncbi:MAG: hypothetical protein JSW13_01285 [Candidatus Aerophobus sp.]|nr:MAG: hypothetical protein JSW13_01285 [Candidatus Aerophobus sp.]